MAERQLHARRPLLPDAALQPHRSARELRGQRHRRPQVPRGQRQLRLRRCQRPQRGPAFGAQVTLAPSDNVFLAVGYATQAEAGNNDWGHFIDVVATIGLTDSMKLVLNADLRFNPMLPGDTTDSLYFGASAALGIDVTDDIAIGARVEYLYGGSGNGAYSDDGRREPPHRHPHLPLHPRRQRHPDPRAAPRLGQRGHLRDPRWRGGHQHVHQHPRRSHRPHRQLSREPGAHARLIRERPPSTGWPSSFLTAS
ncbi:MAG: outer membrane beta-barrel protein [Sandaracinaceae bacterium]|nr:outer membrane beta-barrel protein [Sandaracinaceae bacterium]